MKQNPVYTHVISHQGILLVSCNLFQTQLHNDKVSVIYTNPLQSDFNRVDYNEESFSAERERADGHM